MGSISEWLLTHNSLVIMPKIPWFYVQSFEAQTRVWSLFGTQTWAEPLFAPVLNVLFVWWKHSSSPNPDISSSLGPAAGSADANGSNEEQVPISVSERRPGELNLSFCFKHQVMLSWQRVQQVMQRGRMVTGWGFGSTWEEREKKNKNRSEHFPFWYFSNIPD